MFLLPPPPQPTNKTRVLALAVARGVEPFIALWLLTFCQRSQGRNPTSVHDTYVLTEEENMHIAAPWGGGLPKSASEKSPKPPSKMWVWILTGAKWHFIRYCRWVYDTLASKKNPNWLLSLTGLEGSMSQPHHDCPPLWFSGFLDPFQSFGDFTAYCIKLPPPPASLPRPFCCGITSPDHQSRLYNLDQLWIVIERQHTVSSVFVSSQALYTFLSTW